MLSPVGAYYATGFKPVRLLADPKYVRAWPGGMGDTKCGGNYAPTILPQQQAAGVQYLFCIYYFGGRNMLKELLLQRVKFHQFQISKTTFFNLLL